MRREQRPFESRMSVTQRGALALRLSGRQRLETRGDFCARFRARAPGKA